jgi:PAS domain-containing protein
MTSPPATNERNPEASVSLRTLFTEDRFLQGGLVLLFAAVLAAPFYPSLDPFSLSRHIGLALALFALAERPRFERPEESRFWRDLAFALGFWLLCRVLIEILGSPIPTIPDLLVELLYGGQYVAWCLLLERCPHHADRRKAELEGTLIQPVVAIFVLGFFVYFSWIPKLYPVPDGPVPSVFFYFTLDSYLLLRFLLLWYDARNSPHWSRIYALFSLFLIFQLISYPEDFLGRESLPPLLLTLDPLLWCMPFPFLLIAVRLRSRRPKRTTDRQDTMPSLIDTPSLQTLLATLLFPLVHFSGYLAGILEEIHRRPRELVLMVFLLVLGALALAQHRRSHQRARDLARRKALTANALAKNQASLRLIQERRRTQEELQRAEERNAAIFRASPSGLLLCDLPSGIVREVNQNLELLCARPQEDLLEHSLEETGLWREPRLHQRLAHRLREGQTIHREPTDLLLPDGSPRTVSLSAELLEGSEVSSLLLVLRDHEPHEPTSEHNPSLTGLRSIALVLDGEHRVRAANTAAELFLGLPAEEIMGRSVNELTALREIRAAASGGTSPENATTAPPDEPWQLPLGKGRLLLIPTEKSP